MKKINIKLKIILGIIMLGLVAICIYQSYAIFKESRKLRFIWGVVEDFEQTPDIVINVFVDGEKQEKFPNKENYAFKEMSCTNSGNAEFNEDTWQMTIKNITNPTECDIHFITNFSRIFDFIGDIQEFVVPFSGTYTFELWGASGNDPFEGRTLPVTVGGKGGYTKGDIYLTAGDILYIYVGEKGKETINTPAYNGGGKSYNSGHEGNQTRGGGGATDVRLINGEWDNVLSLRSRIMVAGAGSGATDYNDGIDGGNILDVDLSEYSSYYGSNGTQVEGGKNSESDDYGVESIGGFGIGGSGIYGSSSGHYGGAGGGSGYYGGGGGTRNYPGGGGSSFISGHQGCNAINVSGIHTNQPNHYSGYIFNNTVVIAGNELMPNARENGTIIGNSGNGYAKIIRIN